MNYMKFKIGGNYADLTLMECIEHWGKESGRRMFNIINRRMTNEDIHTPTDGTSLRSSEIPPPPFIGKSCIFL